MTNRQSQSSEGPQTHAAGADIVTEAQTRGEAFYEGSFLCVSVSRRLRAGRLHEDGTVQRHEDPNVLRVLRQLRDGGAARRGVETTAALVEQTWKLAVRTDRRHSPRGKLR